MSEPTAAPRKRRRPALSCEQCRRRKIKCDRNYPCHHCSQSKSAVCTYNAETAKPLNGHVNDAPMEQHGMNRLLQAMNIPPITSLEDPSPESASHFHEHRTKFASWGPLTPESQQGQPSGSSPEVQALVDRVHKLEQMLSERSDREDTSIFSKTPKSAPRQLRGTLSKTRFFGQSHWMHSFGMFDKISCVKENTVTNSPSFNDDISGSDVTTSLERCKAMARAAKAGVHDEWMTNPNFKNYVPSRGVCDQLIDAYFRTSESAYRILHTPTFQREYLQYWEQPFAANSSFILKMLLAMAVGSCFYQEPDGENVRSQAKKWIFAAQSWLSQSPFEKSRLNISGLQVHCLLLLARQALGIVGDLIWISTGSLIRTAFNMGFHRDPKYFPKMTILQAELRRRLWATILEFNAQFSLDSGMNPLISLDDFDTEPPANINDEDVDESTKVQPVSKPSSVFTQTSVQIILLKSLPTRLAIVRLINNIKYEPSYDETLALGEDLTRACKESTTFAQTAHAQNTTPRLTQYQRNLLDIFLRRFLLILHRPFAMRAQNDPRYYFSRKVVLDCGMTLMNYPTKEDGTRQSLKDSPKDDFICLKICSGGFFKGVVVHSAMVIFLELLKQLEEQAPFVEQSKAVREPLKQVLRDTIELAAERISIAENNVKGHLFISAVLGQIEAIEQGKSPELGALEGARKSGRICYELLSARVPPLVGTVEKVLQESAVLNSGVGGVMGWQEGGAPAGAMDFNIQDWALDFDVPDGWLFAGWEEDKCW